MQFRLAKPCDAKELARVHFVSAADQAGSFLPKLGRFFLRQFWRVLLEEPNTVILCAMDQKGQVLGFLAGSLDAAATQRALRSAWFRMPSAALLGLLRRPWLLWQVVFRYRSLIGGEDAGYLNKSGAWCIYWAMLPEARGGINAIILDGKFASLVKLLGVREISFEVDRSNARVEAYHRARRAVVVRELVTPDGKSRLWMKYVFQE